jgi:hypothetical protein
MMLRWMAEITYRNGRDPDVVEFEEIGTARLPRRQKGIKQLIKMGMSEEAAIALHEELNREALKSRKYPNLHDIIERGPDWNDIDQIVITLNTPTLQPEPEPAPTPAPVKIPT